jgi:hypothetical protein
MSGRPSLEKARSLRAQRELAQELSAYLERFASKIQLIAIRVLEDVQEFAEASLQREMRKEKGMSDDEHSGSGSDDEDEGPPIKRKVRN